MNETPIYGFMDLWTTTTTKKKKMEIVAKALDGQRYPLPLCEYMWVCDGERGSGPKGADDLCFFGK